MEKPIEPSQEAAPKIYDVLHELVKPFVSVASLAMAFSAVAYVLGWTRNESYYSAIGATWVMRDLSTLEHIKMATGLILPLSIVAGGTLYAYSEGAVTSKGILKLLIFFVICFAGGGISHLILESIGYESLWLLFGMFGGLFALALTIALTVIHIIERKTTVGSESYFLFVHLCYLPLSAALGYLGGAHADSDFKIGSNLPVVQIKSEPQCTWRLVRYLTNGDMLVIDVDAEIANARLRVVDSKSTLSISVLPGCKGK